MNLVIYMAGGVLLVVVMHLIVGWFLANGLRRELLLVYPREKDLSVRVRMATADRVVLEAPEPRQDIGHPGVLGMVWNGGHGEVGEVLDARDSTITRVFHEIEGTPPICVGPLEDCEPVELDGFVFRSDPLDVGLGFDTITYQTELGPMAAWSVPAGDGRKWAVLCHGWTVDKRELLRVLPTFHRAGWSSLVIDYRNDPGAPVDPTGHYRFGVSEWRDVESAVQHVLDSGAEDVLLMGCSTGAALVMSFLETSKLATRVSAIVLDSPNLILADTVRAGTVDLRATRLMIELGMWIADVRWDIDWEATNHVERSPETLDVPALVFHGTSDPTVPISESRQLRAAVPELVDLVETPAAGHVMSWNADRERYEGYLERFLDRL
ncbi:MAG: hypothetical protein PVG83_10275 [Acidimicrobiia bacterium]